MPRCVGRATDCAAVSGIWWPRAQARSRVSRRRDRAFLSSSAWHTAALLRPLSGTSVTCCETGLYTLQSRGWISWPRVAGNRAREPSYCSGIALLRGKAFRNLTRTEISDRRKLFKLRHPRTRLALFPVINRLPGHANQLSIDRRGQPELGPVCRQPGCAESALRARCRPIIRARPCGRARHALRNTAQFLLERIHLAT